MSPALKKKIQQYKRDGINHFSGTEKIMAALTEPDLYLELMPERYQTSPQEAYHRELDGDQRMFVIARWV